MFFQKRVEDVQKKMLTERIQGWLLYDFQKRNELAWEFLGIPPEKHLTRRFFYWIPAAGEPVKIVHEIESSALDHLPGKKKVYLKWQTLETLLQECLQGVKTVAMEYSPRCSVPYISRIDGGTLDLVRSCGVDVVSSAPFIQFYTSVLQETQITSLYAAGKMVQDAVESAWNRIEECLKRNQGITDYDVVQWIANQFVQGGFETNALPHCALNADSADPHFVPAKETAKYINDGDFILIDLWCKQKQPFAVYADITRVGVVAPQPTQRQQEIFSIVRSAQKAATDFIQSSFREKKVIRGFEVDNVCRKIITDAGYGKYFTHRTGHSITSELHGPGTHLDNLETYDDRPLLAGTCCSCEPGIYLPGEFGVRLEYDLLITPAGEVQIIGGVQENIRSLAR